ncbi:hypothetical protein AJ87_21750 [Rhizobium yanglingense]|nr:hypothetical protein AJ87_21750 [Rhizobium yanglingense]
MRKSGSISAACGASSCTSGGFCRVGDASCAYPFAVRIDGRSAGPHSIADSTAPITLRPAAPVAAILGDLSTGGGGRKRRNRKPAAGGTVNCSGSSAAAPSEAVDAPVTPAERLESVPLTEAQTEIWLAAQTGDEASCSFNLSISLTLDGEFDEAAFSKALSLVTDRHDALRIRFSRAGDYFRFADDFALKAPLVDFAGRPDGEAQLREMLDEDARTPFDLVDGPLARAFIARLAVDKHVFVFSGHHIICDGWSISVLLDELAMAYAAFRNGETPQFEPALSFATYATKLAPTPEKSEKDEQFWLDQFKEIPELPELPLDRTRPEHRNFASGTCTGYIEGDVYKA